MKILLYGILVVVVYFITVYNKLVRLKNRVKNAWAQIDVQLKRRYDLIPNLVETVKGYMAHERETLEKVIKARQKAIDARATEKHIESENTLTRCVRELFAVVENYPDIKANQSAQSLLEELTTTENRISFARQHYNDEVLRYNTYLEIFPQNILAGLFKFKKGEFFKTEDPDREKPYIRF